MRIIGGRLKRSKLPVVSIPGLRPTPDRVRETLFNWLGQDLTGWRVLDAFAGSGALGLEAVSRGAAHTLLIERDGAVSAGLRATCKRLGVDGAMVMTSDALQWMRRASPARFDLVLLDPPFGEDLFVQALQVAAPLVAAQGLLYLEADRPFQREDVLPFNLVPWRYGQAGAVHFHLFTTQAEGVHDYTGDPPAGSAS